MIDFISSQHISSLNSDKESHLLGLSPLLYEIIFRVHRHDPTNDGKNRLSY